MTTVILLWGERYICNSILGAHFVKLEMSAILGYLCGLNKHIRTSKKTFPALVATLNSVCKLCYSTIGKAFYSFKKVGSLSVIPQTSGE